MFYVTKKASHLGLSGHFTFKVKIDNIAPPYVYDKRSFCFPSSIICPGIYDEIEKKDCSHIFSGIFIFHIACKSSRQIRQYRDKYKNFFKLFQKYDNKYENMTINMKMLFLINMPISNTKYK